MPSISPRSVRRITRVVAAVGLVAFAPGVRLAEAQVSGRISVIDAGDRPAQDLGSAVIYLEGRGPRGAPQARVEMAMDARQFSPRVLVIPAGTTVSFPNRDPFNHNVFSLSNPNAFDLGLYGRGESRTQRFGRPGLVRVYCNIHPRMSAFILVRDNAYYTRPGADGTFAIPGVAPGQYTLHAWHERAPEVSRPLMVGPGGVDDLDLTLDARGYQWVQHRNKYGQEYGSGSTRERY